jgi:hypothetical protein
MSNIATHFHAIGEIIHGNELRLVCQMFVGYYRRGNLEWTAVIAANLEDLGSPLIWLTDLDPKPSALLVKSVEAEVRRQVGLLLRRLEKLSQYERQRFDLKKAIRQARAKGWIAGSKKHKHLSQGAHAKDAK